MKFKLFIIFFLFFFFHYSHTQTIVTTSCEASNLVYISDSPIHNLIQLTDFTFLIAIACQNSGIYFEIRDDQNAILTSKLVTDITPLNGYFMVDKFDDGGFVISAFNTQTSLLMLQTFDPNGNQIVPNKRVFQSTLGESTSGVWTMLVTKSLGYVDYMVFAGHMTAVDGNLFTYAIFQKDGSAAAPVKRAASNKLNTIKIAELSNGYIVIAYNKVKSASTVTDIFFRRVLLTSTSTNIDPESTIQWQSSFNRGYSFPIYSGGNEFALVYSLDQDNLPEKREIWYARYQLDGTAIEEIKLSTVQSVKSIYSVKNLFPGLGKWIVSWTSMGQDGDNSGIYFSIQLNGLIFIPEKKANMITAGEQSDHDAIYMTTTTFAFIYQSGRSDQTYWDTEVITYNDHCTVIKPELQIDPSNVNDVKPFPKVLYLENARKIFVIWKGISSKLYTKLLNIYSEVVDDPNCILNYPKIILSKILLRTTVNIPITNSMLSVDDGDKMAYNFLVSQATDGHFANLITPLESISGFTWDDITSKRIIFFRLANSLPTAKLKVSDSTDHTSQEFDISFEIVNPPTFSLALAPIFKGNSIILTPDILDGTVSNGYVGRFTKSNTVSCFLDNIDSPGNRFDSFLLTDLKANKIRLIHDNSETTPSFDLELSDGEEIISKNTNFILKNLAISFIQTINIRIESALTLQAEYLQIDGPDGYLVRSTNKMSIMLRNKANLNVDIALFSKSEFLENQIEIFYNGFSSQPALCLKVSDNINESPSICATFTVSSKPILLKNKVQIAQGEALLIDQTMIQGTVNDNFISSLIYRVISTTNCYFSSSPNKYQTISSFTTDNLIANQVFLVHDGSSIAPFYEIDIFDGESAGTLPATIDFLIMPIMITNYMNLTEGSTIILNKNDINVKGSSFQNYELTYYVGNAMNGYFYLSYNPLESITRFTENDLNQNQVNFVHTSDLEPFFEISTQDNAGFSQPLSVSLHYTRKVEIRKSFFPIEKGLNVIINSNNIDVASLSDDSFLVIYIEENEFCWFENINNPSFEIKSFTKKMIEENTIKLFHDGSDNRPFFKLKASDGTHISKLTEVLIKYDGITSIIIDKNYIFLNQGAQITLTSDMIKVTNGLPDTNFFFRITDIKFCTFYHINDLTIPIQKFKQTDIDSKVIRIVHDNSENAPRFQFSVFEIGNSGFSITLVAKVGFNSKPQLIKNKLVLNKGDKKVINSNFIQANDLEANNAKLIIFIINQKNCRFERRSQPGYMIKTFYQNEIAQKLIQIVHDKSDNQPYYMVSVTDGSLRSDFYEPGVKFFILKGIAGLIKIDELLTNLMSDIQFYKDEEYIIGILYQGTVVIIDIYNPSNPSLIASDNLKETFGFSKLNNLKIVDNIAYISSHEKTIGVVDLSNLDTPVFKGYLDEANVPVCSMDTYENYIYLIFCNSVLKIVFLDSDWKFNNLFEYSYEFESFMAVSVVLSKIVLLTETGKVLILDFNDKSRLPTLISNLELNEKGLDVKLSSTLHYVYALTYNSIFIIDTNNLFQPLIKSQTKFKGGLSLRISSEETYLLVNFNKGMSIFNVENPEIPNLLESLFYTVSIKSMLIRNLIDHIYLSSSKGLQTVKILKANQARLSPFINKFTVKKLDFDTCTHILTAKENDVSYIACKENGLVIFDIPNKVISKILIGTFSAISFPKNEKELYAIKDGMVSIYSIANRLNPIEIKTISTNSDLDFVKISPSQNFFTVISKSNKYFIIYQVDGFNSLSNKVTLKSTCNPNYASFNYNENILYINCELIEILVFNVKNKVDPTLLTSYVYGEIKAMIYYNDDELNEYLFLSDSNQEALIIIDVTSPLASHKIQIRYIGENIGTLMMLPNNNYLIVQSSKKLTILEIRDIERIFLVYEFESEEISYFDQISITESFIYLPYIVSFKLYNGKTFFSPYLQASNSQATKIFSLDLFPINPQTLDKSFELIKLLNVKTFGKWPFWIIFDNEELSLTITPPNKESLYELRSLTITFASHIDFAELNDIGAKSNIEIFDHLLLNGYIDAEGVVTAKYNPEKVLSLAYGYDVDKISEVLSQHYFVHFTNFNLNDFLSLNNLPVVSVNNLQSQVEKLEKIKINKVFDFQFDSLTFEDPDLDFITYTSSKLPSWLNFFPATQRFYGTPTNTDLGKHSITVFAFDGFSTTSDSFELSITNSPPIFLNLNNQFLKLGDQFDWQMPPNTFVDPDGDELTYKVKIKQNKILLDLPSWLSFDKEKNKISGKPENKDITKDTQKNSYFQIFEIVIIALDLATQESSTSFLLTITNSAPIYDIKSLAHNPQSIILGLTYDWSLPGNSFSDPDADVLKYSCYVKNGENYENIPNWLTFDEDRKRLFGTPAAVDVEIIVDENKYKYYKLLQIVIRASDVVELFSEVSFNLIIINHSPIYNPTSQLEKTQFIIFGQKYQFNIPSNAFYDIDNDPLTYQARLENDDVLPSWLNFDKDRKLLLGSPQTSDVSYLKQSNSYYRSIKIRVSVSDSVSLESSVVFELIIYNNAPLYETKSLANNPQTHILGLTFDWTLPGMSFSDPDGDILKYSCYLKNGDQYENIPNWLTFDAYRNRLFGTPSVKDVGYIDGERKYFKLIEIVIRASDVVDLSSEFTFKLSIINHSPNFNADSRLEKTQFLILGEKYQFNVPSIAFYDIDNDPLLYEAHLENGVALPSWLNFDQDRKLFIGTPQISDVIYLKQTNSYYLSFKIFVSVSDPVLLKSSAAFNLIIYNNPPIYNVESHANNEQTLILGLQYDWFVPGFSFSEPDGETISCNCFIDSDKQLPKWLNFESDRKRIFGFPSTSDINFDIAKKMYYQEFNIMVIASDMIGLKTSFSFKLVVVNHAPEVNDNIVKSDDKFQGSNMGKFYDYSLKEFSFLDSDKDSLIFSAWLLDGEKEGELPLWLQFDSGRNRLFGTPQKSDIQYDTQLQKYYQVFKIRIKATDPAKLSAYFDLELKISNTKPSASSVPDMKLLLGNNLAQSLPVTTFFDIDGDILRYEAKRNDDEALPNWLIFDRDRLLFTGSPTTKDVKYVEKERAYLQDFILKVSAYDVADEQVDVIFKLSVFNYAPRINPNRTLYKQFINSDPQINKITVLNLDPDTFINLNGDKLEYEASLAYSKENNSLLPDWIAFDANKRSFVISPTQKELYKSYYLNITVKNSLFESWDILEFKVVASWEYIITILGSVGAAFGTIAGLLKYRTTLFALLLKKKYQYPHFNQAAIDNFFEYDIFLISEDYQIAKTIFRYMNNARCKKKKTWDQYIKENDQLSELINLSIIGLKKNSKKFHFKQDVILQKGYRIYDIISAFIIYNKINLDIHTKLVLENLRNRMEKKNFKQWCSEFVSIEAPEDFSLISKTFPNVNLNKAHILREIAESCEELKKESQGCLCCKRKKFNPELVDKNLICEAIISLAIGIPMIEKDSKTEGECLLIDQKSFLEIEIDHFYEDNSLLRKLIMNLPQAIRSVVHNTNWLDYKFKTGMLSFFGLPDKNDVGKYQIRIYDKKGFLLREFYVEVVEKVKIKTTLPMYQHLRYLKMKSKMEKITSVKGRAEEKMKLNIEKENEEKQESIEDYMINSEFKNEENRKTEDYIFSTSKKIPEKVEFKSLSPKKTEEK